MYIGGIDTVWAQKVTQEKSIKSTKILNYINSSYVIFCAENLDIYVVHVAYKKNRHILI